jgi:hypothetical protein
MVIDLAGDLAMLDGAQLASFSQGRGSAGSITLTGVNLRMIGGDQQRSIIQSDTFTLGEGGEITLNLTGDLAMQQAAISSQTQGAADAGSIRIQARNLTMDGVGRPTLITSSAFASGSAGAIRLDIGDRLMFQDGGVITTSSVGEGDAGVIEITAGQLEMDGSNKGQPTLIASEARGEGEGLVGGVGDISIQAGEILLRNDANISIAARGSSDQSGEQRRIRLETGRLGLSRSTITAESDGDTPAANIEIHADGELVIADRTAITTASEQADAGEIRISGGRLSLEHSRITTSVSGEQGNGGNIQLNHDGVIMDQGFIQANTAAQGASGGEITLESPYLLVPRTQAFITGGDQRLDYDPERPASVIQAAAPDGISGQIEIEVPEIDLSASVLAVDAGLARLIELAPNPCRLGQSGIPSSLSLVGRGALPDDLAMGRASGHSTCNDSSTPAE